MLPNSFEDITSYVHDKLCASLQLTVLSSFVAKKKMYTVDEVGIVSS